MGPVVDEPSKGFPVTDGHLIVGILFHGDVVQALSAGSPDKLVGDFIHRDCFSVDKHEPLQQAIDKMHALQCPTLLVQYDAELVGLLSQEHLSQWVVLHSSLQVRKES